MVANIVNPSTPGWDGTDVSREVLFARKYEDDVRRVFTAASVTEGLFTQRQVTGAKSTTFPRPGAIGGGYHSRGDTLDFKVADGAEIQVFLDRPFLASQFVDDWDDDLNYWDTLGVYAQNAGETIARNADYWRIASLIKAAATAAILTQPTGLGAQGLGTVAGTVVTDADVASSTNNIVEALINAQRILDVQNVPQANRHIITGPTNYYLIAQKPELVNNQWTANTVSGGTNSYEQQIVGTVAGAMIHKSNIWDDAMVDITNETDQRNDYAVDATNGQWAYFHQEAVCVANAFGPTVEMDRQIMWQGTPIVAKYAQGSTPLRPEAAVFARTANP